MRLTHFHPYPTHACGRIEKKRMRARPKNWKEDLQASRKAKLERALAYLGLEDSTSNMHVKQYIDNGKDFVDAITESCHTHYLKEHLNDELRESVANALVRYGWTHTTSTVGDYIREFSDNNYPAWHHRQSGWRLIKGECPLPDKLPWLQNQGDRSLDQLIQDAMEFGDPGITAKNKKAAAAELKRKDALRERERVLVKCSSFTGIDKLVQALSRIGVGVSLQSACARAPFSSC